MAAGRAPAAGRRRPGLGPVFWQICAPMLRPAARMRARPRPAGGAHFSLRSGQLFYLSTCQPGARVCLVEGRAYRRQIDGSPAGSGRRRARRPPARPPPPGATLVRACRPAADGTSAQVQQTDRRLARTNCASHFRPAPYHFVRPALVEIAQRAGRECTRRTSGPGAGSAPVSAGPNQSARRRATCSGVARAPNHQRPAPTSRC